MPQKILIAEREEMLRETPDFARSLTIGYSPSVEVETTSNGQDFLRRARNGDYTVIYVGCCFDGDYGSGSGLSFVRAIRQIDQKTPVYLLSMPVCPIGESEAMEAGATGYVPHLDFDKFKDTLATHAKQSSDE